MDILVKLINPLFGFLMTLVFGFWLTRRGKPYHGLLFNVHKLVALGTVILSAMAVYRGFNGSDSNTLTVLSLVIALIGVIALFASGALMSAGKGEYHMMKLVHHIAPFLAFFGMALAAYLLELV